MFFFFFTSNPYIAIIGDIKKSKKIKEREIFQNQLNSILKKVNQLYSSSISSKFTITLGDEFQGLLHSGDYSIYKKRNVSYRNKIWNWNWVH